MEAVLQTVRSTYAERARTMAQCLQQHLGNAVAFNAPQGGMFFWARLTGEGGTSQDANAFAQRAIEQLVAFVPGAPFYAHDADPSTFRLSFATADLDKIREGVARLARAL
jgi:DNA-binding transcriptional MocR family regulator